MEHGKPTELDIINGGVDLTVRLRTGERDNVKVRQLPIRLMKRWAELQGDEPALVELYCDLEEGWADTLVIESYDAIVELGDTLNRPIFDRWTSRRMDATDRMVEAANATRERTQKASDLVKQLRTSASS